MSIETRPTALFGLTKLTFEVEVPNRKMQVAPPQLGSALAARSSMNLFYFLRQRTIYVFEMSESIID